MTAPAVHIAHAGRDDNNVAANLRAVGDINKLRCYVANDGKTYYDQHQGYDSDGNPKYEPVQVNNDSALPWQTWRDFDRVSIDAAYAEPRLLGDLRAAPGVTTDIDAMSTTVISYQKRTSRAHARVGMDPSVRSERDRPKHTIGNTPVPFIYSDWQFPERDIRIAAAGGTPLDLTQIRACTDEVLRVADDLILGDSATPFDYDGIDMPGILQFGDAIPAVITAPTTLGWSGEVLYNELNTMRQLSIDNQYPGPWWVYMGSAWDLYLNKKWSSLYPSNSIRNEILGMDGIQGIRMLRRLTSDFRIIMIQLTPQVIRLYNGMSLRNIQWRSLDGWNVYGKVIMSIAIQLRSDALGQTGVIVGSPPA